MPTSAVIDSLDPTEIELWFADGAFRSHQLKSAIAVLADQTDDRDEE